MNEFVNDFSVSFIVLFDFNKNFRVFGLSIFWALTNFQHLSLMFVTVYLLFNFIDIQKDNLQEARLFPSSKGTSWTQTQLWRRASWVIKVSVHE